MKYIRTFRILAAASFSLASGEDSLAYPELFSAALFEEPGNGARIVTRLSLKENFSYQHTAVLERAPFTLYYTGLGASGDPEQLVSCSFSAGPFRAGAGRGRVHIAKGLILGNTMMRFSPDPASNFRMEGVKAAIGNYTYCSSLIFAGAQWKSLSADLFRIKDITGASLQYRNKALTSGLAFYRTADAVAEIWTSHSGKILSGQLNASFCLSGVNHLAGEILIRQGPFRWHAGAVWLSPDFTACSPDSKWGSGLIPGSCGFTAAGQIPAGFWKLRSAFYAITHPRQRESRYWLSAGYARAPFEFGLFYDEKYQEFISASACFPFPENRQSEHSRILKGQIKLDLSRSLHLDAQVQADLLHRSACAALTRLSYRHSGTLLRLQLSRGYSDGTVLYILRPASASRYTIRRMPVNDITYLDLLYSAMLGPLRCSLLLCSEGVSAEFEMKW
ncbi:MAG: hypothetical protein JXR21_00765 [Candidatus Marinimicrobia bacterium]|nr:hypothetical protein [Candidatus Neomarinimicrobiota bacterium]